MDERLRRLYEEDQADRRHGLHPDAQARDERRRRQVEALVAAGTLACAEDSFHAAMVLQHGSEREHYRRAHELAMRAVELGSEAGRWLAAATLDRWLMAGGLPQRFGTQFRSEGGRWVLWTVDPATSDAERAEWSVPPLAEALRRVEELTARDPPALGVGTVETARLRLERPAEADVAELYRLWLDARVQRFLGGRVPEREAEARALGVLAHWERHGFGPWVVRELASGAVAGLCGLASFEDTPEVEVVYKLFPAHWGRGVATEAGTASLAVGFGPLGLERVVAMTQAGNLASRRVLDKLGLRHLRDLRRHGAEQRWYEIAAGEWRARSR
jgi:RimJ/RimL family protein N-acetyltransferase